MRTIKGFERALWAVRYVVLVPVVVVAVAAIGVVMTTTVDAFHMGRQMAASWGVGSAAPSEHIQPFGTVLQVTEGYLLAAILIIFAMGLYELFIAKIEMIERSENAPRTLVIRSIDDLKERLGRVVLLALVIEFFQQSLRQDYRRPIDLLYMASGIVLVGVALYLSAQRGVDGELKEEDGRKKEAM